MGEGKGGSGGGMLKFSGKKIRRPNSKAIYHRVEIHHPQKIGDKTTDVYQGYFCNAAAEVMLAGEDPETVGGSEIYEAYCDDEGSRSICAWGYDGHAPNLCSVNILALSLGITSRMGEGRAVYYGIRGRVSKEDRETIMKHYRPFTQQFTSKFGDEWTMTSDQVMEWIKQQEGGAK